MEDTPATRQATKTRIGPWYVLQSRNPAAPGMRFATLLALVAKGQITPKSVVRGPTTHQLWRFAAHVRGLSREFGLCYSCGEQIERQSTLCPHCERSQEPPPNPDTLLESRDSMVMMPNAAAPAPATAAPSPGVNGGSAPHRDRPGPGQRIPPKQPQPEPVPQTPSGARREYEIPTPPAPTPRNRPGQMAPVAAAPMAAPAPVPMAPQPAPVPAPAPSGGEYSERLRSLNNGDAGMPRPQHLRHDPRTLSAMELASALQHEGDDFEDPPVSVKRVLLFVVLLALVGGGVFLYLSPDYRAKTTAWAQEQWGTLRDRFSRFQLQRTATTPPTPAKQSPPAVADTKIPSQTGSSVKPTDRTGGPTGATGPSIVTKKPPQPQRDSTVDAGRDDAGREPTRDVAAGQDATAAAGSQGNSLRGGPMSTAHQAGANNDVKSANDAKTGNDTKSGSDPKLGNDSKPANDTKVAAADTKQTNAAGNPNTAGNRGTSGQATPSGTNGGTMPSTAGTPTKPPVPPGFPDPATASADDYLEFQKKLYLEALDFEANGDFAQALDRYNKIKLLPAFAHPTSLQVNIDRVKRLQAEAGK